MSGSLYKRSVFEEIVRFLTTDDIIVIHGARQVGKTSILMYLQDHLQSENEQVLYLDLEDSRFVSMMDKGVDEFITYLSEQGFDLPGLLKSGKKLFVMIDEIQYLSNPSSFLKLLADHHRYLKIVVSGSSSFEMKSKFKDSLVGRTVSFEIYPLSFQEFLLFKGIPYSPAGRFTEKKTIELQTLYTEFVLYGGYPKIVLTQETDVKEKYLQQIIDTYIRKDIRDLAEIKDVNKFNRLLEALASQSGNLLIISELSNTCGLARDTIERYLFLLEQTYILRLVRPFSRNIRSELFKTPKVFFYDTGLMQMLWLKRLQKEILGPVFETSVFTELVKRYGKDQVHYWRTQDKKEIDFVVKLQDAVLPLETKLHFPRTIPTVLGTFVAAYPSDNNSIPGYRLVGLEGKPAEEGMVFPWQL
ncbi:MAG TPA: ATP-binding protein [Anaerolineales bacterium]|nr:ATP-binding protein [Anaerolineales bacterium]